MNRTIKYYLYEPTKPPLPLRAGQLARFEAEMQKADDSKSGEQREAQYGVTVGGVKCAKRVYSAAKWWDAMQKSTVNATCAAVKAEDICGGEFRFSDELSDKQRDEFTAIIENGQQDLVDAARDAEATGWANFECVPLAGGGLSRINHLPSHTCWVDLAVERVAHTFDGQASHTTIYPLLSKASARETQCAWLNNNHYPYNTYYGVPDSWTVLTQIETVWAGINWNRDFFNKNGGYSWLMILKSPPGQIDETHDGAILDVIDAHIKDARGSNADLLSIPIGNHTIELHKLSADNKDIDFKGLIDLFTADIQSAHRVPDSVLGRHVPGALGGTTIDEEHDNYLKRVIKPKQRRWAKLINSMFYTYYGVVSGFHWGGEETIDIKDLAVPVRELYVAGLIRHGEAREMIGQEIDERFGDCYYDELHMPNEPAPQFGDNDNAS